MSQQLITPEQALQKILDIANMSTWSDLDTKPGFISEMKHYAELGLKAVERPTAVNGAVWVKGDYERLYARLKAGVERPIACFVDYLWDRKNPQSIMRDICMVKTGRTDFIARGINYGGAGDVTADAEREEFLEECERLNVEWLDTSPTAAGDGKEEACAFTEWTQRKKIFMHNKGYWVCANGFGEITTVADNTAKLYDIFKQQKKQCLT